MPRVKAIIAEDEAILREEFAEMLGSLWPDLDIVAQVEDGVAALAALDAHAPDILFLDIHMPRLGGLDVARQVTRRCHVVFITAYQEFAIAAFEQGAVDYVLKPFTASRLATTVTRLRQKLSSEPADLSRVLEKLERMMTTPDEARQDAAPSPLERRLATILCADVAGYSHMMGNDEERTVRVFRGHRDMFESLVRLHRGRIFNTAGDALLAEFNSAVEAVRCATEMQAALATRNQLLPPDERMLFRMGINLGDVIVQGGDLLGDGVNVAARIQAATQPGGVCISGSVYDQIQNKLSLDFKLLGEQTYKNIAKPVRTYALNEGIAVTAPARRLSWKIPAAIAALVLAIGGTAYWMVQQYHARRAPPLAWKARPPAAAAGVIAANDIHTRPNREATLSLEVQHATS